MSCGYPHVMPYWLAHAIVEGFLRFFLVSYHSTLWIKSMTVRRHVYSRSTQTPHDTPVEGKISSLDDIDVSVSQPFTRSDTPQSLHLIHIDISRLVNLPLLQHIQDASRMTRIYLILVRTYSNRGKNINGRLVTVTQRLDNRQAHTVRL